MVMKWLVSYNGFFFGFLCRNDDLKFNEVVLEGILVFFGEWNVVNCYCYSLIRLLNYVVDCLILNGFVYEFYGLENFDISLIELSDVFGGSDLVW